MNTITFGEWVGCFFVIFIHLIENSGGYFYWCRLFLWLLDINLQNFARGYFSKFSLRGLQYSPCDKINYFWWSSIFDQPDNCRTWPNPSETSSWSASLLRCYCSRYLPKLKLWPRSTLVSGTRRQPWRWSWSSILLHWRRTKWEPWPWVWKKLRLTDNLRK